MSSGPFRTVLTRADTASALSWALLASGQIKMRIKMRTVNGGLASAPVSRPIDLAARNDVFMLPDMALGRIQSLAQAQESIEKISRFQLPYCSR